MRCFTSLLVFGVLSVGANVVHAQLPAATTTSALEDGISVLSVGAGQAFLQHFLVVSVPPTVAPGKPSVSVTLDQIATQLRAKNLGPIENLLNRPSTGGMDPFIRIGDIDIRRETIVVILDSKDWDGKEFRTVRRGDLLKALSQAAAEMRVSILSVLDPEKSEPLATRAAIANGRERAKSIAEAGGVRLGKLLAVRQEPHPGMGLTTRLVTINPEGVRVENPGGVYATYALRFAIK